MWPSRLPVGWIWLWARERSDEATTRWCFDRLPQSSGDTGCLQARQGQWRASDLPWDDYCRTRALEEGLHVGQGILGRLDARVDSQLLG